jgi:molybdate transport system substrate-binding protein
MPRLRNILLIGLVLLLQAPAAAGAAREASQGPLLVFAAASTTNAMQKAANAFTRASGIPVAFSFASSGTLAKQIAQGAPADVYLSANVKWMDHLANKGFIVKGSRVALLRNQLVLVAPAASPLAGFTVGPRTDLAAKLNGGWLAMGDPRHVPAGIYGKQALVRLGLWPQVRGRAALAASVRAALMLVERGEASLGVVYATDAKISPQVKVVGVFPPESHEPIVYPAAMVAGREPQAARRYLDFLQGPEATAIFLEFGFQAQ